jgi:VWFA-related protein
MSHLAIGMAACLLLAPQQRPVFRGSADVVLVDARIIGRDGRQVSDLVAQDFLLKVDGQVREILTVEFQRSKVNASFTRLPSQPLSGGRNATSSRVMFAPDVWRMRPESSRFALDQAAALVDRLDAFHAVALFGLPKGSPRIDFTHDKSQVASALRKLLGVYHDPLSTMGAAQGVEDAAKTVASLDGLAGLIDSMASLDGRRTIVYFADGLADEKGGRVVTARALALTRKAAAAGVVLYAVASDPPSIASDISKLADRYDAHMEYDSMGNLATATGGAFLRRMTQTSNVMTQLEHELAGQYLISFSASADAKGKPHRIELSVTRDGVDVHARREFIK